MEKISADDVLLKELEAMGFDKKKAEEALIETGNESVMKAVSWITSRPIDSDDGFIDDGDVVYDEEVKEDDKNEIEKDDKKKDDKKDETEKDDKKKLMKKKDSGGGLTVKIRKFDSGTTWEEKIKEEQNEESEWPVVETKYEFSQKRSIAKGSFGRVYVATCPSKSSRLLAIKVVNIEPYVDSTFDIYTMKYTHTHQQRSREDAQGISRTNKSRRSEERNRCNDSLSPS